MPKRKTYTISQIADVFYAGATVEKLKKMVETLTPIKKNSRNKVV
jgi:hypothetical protein